MSSNPVLKLGGGAPSGSVIPKSELLEQLVLFGYPKEISEAALIATQNKSLDQAIDWIEDASKSKNTSNTQVSSEVTPMNVDVPTTTSIASPAPTPMNVDVSTTSIASLANLPPPNIKVESRFSKKAEEEKRKWETEQNKKDYERLQKEKRAKKEREAQIKAQIEAERRERSQKIGETKTKTKEEQELAWRQKETDRETMRIVQQRAEERREKERVVKLLEEDRLNREIRNPMATTPTTPASSTITPTKSTSPSTSVNKEVGTCMLQIRLPHGNPLRQKFSNLDLLLDVHDFVASQLEPGVAFTFIIPMPKREFTHEDMNKTLSELALNGVSLTVLTSLKRGVVKQAPTTENTPANVDDMTYEELVDLGNRIGPHKAVPEESVNDKINKIPIKKFVSTEEEPPLCLICQCPFEEGEELKELECKHPFHVICIDPWLRDHDSCPLCNAKVY